MSHYDARAMPGSFWINLQTKTETTNQAIAGVLAEIKGLARPRSPIRNWPKRSPS
jgi:hypothetical protein